MKISKSTIIRTVLLVLALTNQVLTICGKAPLPFADETVAQAIATVFTTVTSLIAWWKNNSFTNAALAADDFMKTFLVKQTDVPDTDVDEVTHDD